MTDTTTTWTYVVPYCDSIQHAFTSLLWETFQARLYRGDRAARSLYALRRSQGDEGTHSVLDMTGVSSLAGDREVSPLSRDELIEVFGTATPTRTDWRRATLPEVPAWQGRYVVLYHRGLPREIAFFGRSGVELEHDEPVVDEGAALAVHVTQRGHVTVMVERWVVEGRIVDWGGRGGLEHPADPVDYRLEPRARLDEPGRRGVVGTGDLLRMAGISERKLDEAVAEAASERAYHGALVDDIDYAALPF